MLVRFLRSSFVARRFFCSSTVEESFISSTVAIKEASVQKTTNSSEPVSPFRGSLGRRLIRKSNSENVATVIAKWREDGGVVSMYEFVSAIHGLKDNHRYADALTVRDSMLEIKDLQLNSVDYASHISLIHKVHGLQSAEKFYDGIPEEMKDGITSAALLQVFVTAGESAKAEALIGTIKKSGFLTTYHPYIHMLSFYLSKEQFDKAKEMITELKKVTSPKGYIYNMLLSVCASWKYVEGAESTFEQMKEANLHKNLKVHATLADLYIEKKLFEKAGAELKEIEALAPCSENSCILIGMHGKMGNKDEVIRIWDNYKSKSKRSDREYDSMVRSLVKLGMFEKAEEIFKEWESIVSNPLFCSVSNLLKKYEGKMSLDSVSGITEEGKVESDAGSEEEKVEVGLG